MFGSYTLYDLFEIDASDIWSYERNRFYNSDQSDNNKQFIERIYSSHNKAKKDILKFFASYFSDFETFVVSLTSDITLLLSPLRLTNASGC